MPQSKHKTAGRKPAPLLAVDSYADELIAAIPIGVMFTDMADQVHYLNPALARILPCGDEREGDGFIGRNVRELLGQLFGVGTDALHTLIEHSQAQAEHPSAREIETPTGRILSCSIRMAHDAEGRPLSRMWMFEDVTENVQANLHLHYLVDHDALTGLFNRRRMQKELERTLIGAERMRQRMALLIFDLDHFKAVNDLHGHSAGDALLTNMASVLSGQIRRNEVLARLGGDEFAILVPEATEADVKALAERVVRAVSGLSMTFKGQRTRQTCSVGVAFYPDHGRSAEDLLECADAAMYQAKRKGRNRWCIWHETDEASCSEESAYYDWEVRIDNALDHDRMRLYYQGTYACATGDLSHLDALVRLQGDDDPAQVFLPGKFLPIAEQNGRIRDIDHWVVEHGIRTLRSNQALSALSVKLSFPSQLDVESSEFIVGALEREAVDPARLIVEMTEDAVSANVYQAKRIIGALRSAGSRICLARFGSGFASLDNLRHLDVDLVKIDSSFMPQLASDQHNQICVKTMTGLAHALGKRIVAGRVEDFETHRVLLDLGLDYVQGHHFGLPVAIHPALGSNGKACFSS